MVDGPCYGSPLQGMHADSLFFVLSFFPDTTLDANLPLDQGALHHNAVKVAHACVVPPQRRQYIYASNLVNDLALPGALPWVVSF